eukprot:TRINITY_DN2639_c0_g1_i6.p1 TRINITY_DN2639_c0_g1~~TRINITY_DN2639_c0_g1_i6.p1  ORF type:complete len:380 (+),score=59.28 TRINITY_DN2639_c0_g1_i6:132-1271(+)
MCIRDRVSTQSTWGALLLINSLFLCYGLLKKSQIEATSLTNSQNKRLEVYARSIFKELNEYRKDNGFGPHIRWLPNLAATTTQEAQNIADQKNFGQHSKFHQWEQAVSNKYFTELSVIVNTKLDGRPPSPKVLGLSVLCSLEQNQKFYLIHSYTSGAVSVIQNPKKKYQYIAVIHLLRKNKQYSSCLEAKNLGDHSKFITKKINGKLKKFKCSNEYGGGWTMIHKMNKKILKISTTKINDFGFKYSEIYFKGAKDHYTCEGGCNNFKISSPHYLSKGFNFQLNWLKFGDTWYMSKETPWGYVNVNKAKHAFYTFKDVKKIGKVDRCSWANNNKLDMCSQSFIMKKQPAGGINAISNCEAVMPQNSGDNCYHYHFELYVR